MPCEFCNDNHSAFDPCIQSIEFFQEHGHLRKGERRKNTAMTWLTGSAKSKPERKKDRRKK